MNANPLLSWVAVVLLSTGWAVHADPPGRVQAAAAAAPARPLDLTTPALSRLYTHEELRYILAQPDADADLDDVPDVSVQAEHYVAVPMGQFQAIPWAILHPTQAWRIFTPVISP
ncbi:MAG TPA: hypothetical protein VMB48_14805 [Steroidobacteraceae bacterium]|nr:hypothetical protein [Steroidobacteraceae bacterium]